MFQRNVGKFMGEIAGAPVRMVVLVVNDEPSTAAKHSDAEKESVSICEK
jgi:hypothetical protein